MTISELKKIYTGKIYVDEDVLASAPEYSNPQPIQVFRVFRVSARITAEQLEDEYKKRGLIPADIRSLALHVEENPHVFASTQWKDEGGNHCFATFCRWNGERSVCVDRGDYVWYDYWSFGGVANKPFNYPKAEIIGNIYQHPELIK